MSRRSTTELRPMLEANNETDRQTDIQQTEKTKEGNVLLNDALNTFYLRLNSVGHMVKDHSDGERINPLPPLNGQQAFFYMHHTHRITHTTACYTSCGALAGTRNNSMGPT